jgi:hypothetical protein
LLAQAPASAIRPSARSDVFNMAVSPHGPS